MALWKSTPKPLPVSGGIGGAYAPPIDWEGLGNLLAQGNAPAPSYDPGPSYAPPDYAPSDGGGSTYTIQYLDPPPAPQKILEQSPEWLAYINALGLQKGQFAADIERQRQIAQGNAAYAAAQIEPKFAQQRRGITASAEGQGMARSGMLQRNLAQSRAGEKQAYTGIYNTLNNTVSDLQSQLAQKNLDLDTQRAQQQATLLGQGYVQDPAFKKFLGG